MWCGCSAVLSGSEGGWGITGVYAAEQSKLSANYTCGEYLERDTIPKVLHWSMSNKLKVMSATIQLWDPQDRKYQEQNSKKISNRWQLQNRKKVQKMYSTAQGVNYSVIAV